MTWSLNLGLIRDRMFSGQHLAPDEKKQITASFDMHQGPSFVSMLASVLYQGWVNQTQEVQREEGGISIYPQDIQSFWKGDQTSTQ